MSAQFLFEQLALLTEEQRRKMSVSVGYTDDGQCTEGDAEGVIVSGSYVTIYDYDPGPISNGHNELTFVKATAV